MANLQMTSSDAPHIGPSTETESAWLSFLSGAAQQQQQSHQLVGSNGLTLPLSLRQQPSASSSSAGSSRNPTAAVESATSAAYPAAMPIGPELFTFDVPPLGPLGASNPSSAQLPSHSGQPEQHDALGRFHDLFHPSGVGHLNSSQSSALHSPRIDSTSAGSSGRASPPSDAQPTTSPHDDTAGHLSTFFSSFFPPPEPSHFTGSQSLQESSHPPTTLPIERRPSSNFSFSPTAFANLHLPPLPGLGGSQDGGSGGHHSHDVHLPPNAFGSADLELSPAQAHSLTKTSSSVLQHTERPSISRTSTTVDSPISPLLALASSSAAPTPGPSTDSSPIGSSTSSRGRKRAPLPSKDNERSTRRPSIAPASRVDDDTGARPPTAPPAIVIGGEIDSPSEVANREAMEDDKRRRNTEASARFRAKKKQNAVHLTRTVSDLSSRVQELEVEAGTLRQENVFLRELVISRAQAGAVRASAGNVG